MKALITGAAGFLGRYVSKTAAQHGYRVTGLGNGPAELDALSAWGVEKWYQSPVTLDALEEKLGDIDVVIHCAGGASVAHSFEDPASDFRRTVDSTIAVLEFVRRRAGRVKLVLTSSAAVYGKAHSEILHVSTPLSPVSPYGLHKKIAEDLCRSYGEHFGVRTAIIRLFSVYGPELRKQLLWDACTRLSRGENQFSGTGEETRDWLHVEDAADLLLVAALNASTECPAANGGTGVSTTVREIVETIGRSLPNRPVPQFTGDRRSGDPDHLQADISEAHAWGWAPRRDWRHGMVEYVTWYQGTQR